MSRSNLDYGFVVAAFAGVMYDWVLTFGQEVELVWRQRWSLITVLFLGVRYLGIIFAVLLVLISVPTISLTDADSSGFILYVAANWVAIFATVMLGVIMIARLYAMYQGSGRKVLIPLVVVFVAANIVIGVGLAMTITNVSGEEVILSGTYQCAFNYNGDYLLLDFITWILGTVWEVLALSLAVWIAVKHFRELRQYSAGGMINDCFTVLMKTHMAYFTSVVGLSCLGLGSFFPPFSTEYSLRTQIYLGLLAVFRSLQMFVLGPRLILGVREYYAKVVTDSDAATGMASIVFQERVHVSTSSSV
ncbi:hypothetical protein EV702DRAFT_1278863 [Suillus placidus]|uniref:DUF6533 domain-containing protein n=1 Tax=Suillus placidus TaxID=48579 RepID=A0A9P6ZUG0_9AGAM|nr:hypothetical protein EV702DRAFT_1278863 [Suillus placidus]